MANKKATAIVLDVRPNMFKNRDESGKRYILWSDIQNTFEDVVFLKDLDEIIVLFMIGQDGELYVSFH